MKILILCNHLNIGGISSYAFLLARGLIKQGHKVWVIGRGELVDRFKEHKIEIIPFDLRIKSELDPCIFISTYKLKKYFLELGDKPDILHANTRTTSIIAYFLAKSFNIPYISTCHGLYKVRWTRKIFPFLGEFVIAVSKEVETQLLKGLKVSPSKIRLIYNGIDVDYFSSKQIKRERKIFGFKEDDFIIGNISRLIQIKGQDLLISAMPHILKVIAEAKLVLVGEGNYEGFLRNKVKELSLDGKVFFLGSLKDTRPILKIMDVFCFIPRYEGFGLSLLEAMAMKVPIVASNVSEIPYILENGKAGILISSDVKSLVCAILDLYRNPTKRKELTEYAFMRVKEFSYTKMAEQTQEVYNQALSKYYEKTRAYSYL